MRPDIQALRGLAVLLVVLYHARFEALKTGYLGVDVFFVISGYLITRLVKTQIESGEFSFLHFYARRVRRLLPAAYVTFFVTAIASSILLNQRELQDFAQQMTGAISFSANFILRDQSGYFSGKAELKPLLHTWSLSIEEQYYLLLPASLVFLPRRFWTIGASVLLAASLGFCLFNGPKDPNAAFYLLPARAWELALGSIGALALDRYPWGSGKLGSTAYWISVTALAGLPFAPALGSHPGWNALAICLATLFVILARKEALARSSPGRFLGWFGDISYSLYLVHWPLFALLHNVWFGPVPSHIYPLIAVTSIFLAYLQFRFIESPFRQATIRFTPRTVACLLVSSLLLVTLPYAEQYRRRNEIDYSMVRRVNFGLSEACDQGGDFVPLPHCRTSDRPSILVWGDSFAMHLVPGIVRTRGNQEVIQATRSSCGPLLGLAHFERNPITISGRKKAESCTKFNDSVLSYLAEPNSPEVVVISSAFPSYFFPAYLLLEDGRDVHEPGLEIALRHFKRTIAAVRALGKRIIVVGPAPNMDLNAGSCQERKVSGRFMAGPYSDCRLAVELLKLWHVPMEEFFEKGATENKVDIIRFKDVLCDTQYCETMLDGKLLYLDQAHLTYDGSEILARRIGLVPRILANAR